MKKGNYLLSRVEYLSLLNLSKLSVKLQIVENDV